MNKRIINYDQYKGLVSKICRDITLSNWRPDYIVGLTRGGCLPAVMISHYFNVRCEMLKVSLRDGDASSCESNLWMAEDAFGYENYDTMASSNGRKNILIVDDINDSGATLNWIMEDWQSGCLPNHENWGEVFGNNVKFAVVIDNLASNCKVKMDFVGDEINKAENNIWIEFPYEEWWK